MYGITHLREHEMNYGIFREISSRQLRIVYSTGKRISAASFLGLAKVREQVIITSNQSRAMAAKRYFRRPLKMGGLPYQARREVAHLHVGQLQSKVQMSIYSREFACQNAVNTRISNTVLSIWMTIDLVAS
jgi:hypothetical protein